MKAIIEVDVPDYQIGQEVRIYFKDTMMIKGIVQEPKTGHWDSRTCKCSECGYQIAFSEYAERKYKYCPDCGARMESME